MSNRTTKTSAEVVPLANNDANTVVALIDRFMTDPSVQVEKLEQLFDLQLRINEKNNKTIFAAALSDCQAEMEPVAKDASNPSTRSKYTSLDALDRAIRPIYTKHGFAISFNTAASTLENHVEVIGYLSHASGFEKTYRIDVPADGKGARGNDVMTKTHALGSATTYGRRYLLSMMFNVAPTDKIFRDDDGNAASVVSNAASGIVPNAAQAPATAENIAEIKSLMATAKPDIAKFFEYLDISDLSDLTKGKFERAKFALMKKIEELKAKPKAKQSK